MFFRKEEKGVLHAQCTVRVRCAGIPLSVNDHEAV
jgi:hypothetical protein